MSKLLLRIMVEMVQMVTSSLTHVFKSVLFIFQIFQVFSVRLLISSLILLLSEDILFIISVLLNLRLGPLSWSLCHVVLKRMCIL